METIAFRIWDKDRKKFWDSGSTPSMLKSFFENTAVLHTRDEMPYQQYTGLSDKGGTWIYEGDIVKSDDGKVYEVEFIKERGYFGFIDIELPRKQCTFGDLIEFIEVIGDIYSNPELLKS